MSNEIIRRDDNRITTLAGLTDDAAQEIRNLLVDPVSGRLKVSAVITGGAGTGDVSSNTATSVDGEIALFSGNLGKTIKRATGTGLAKITSGVLSTAVADTDYLVPSTASTTYVAKSSYTATGDILAGTGAGTYSAVNLGANTLLGRIAGGVVSVAIDSDLTSVSANDDTVPSAKATKAYADSLVAGLLDYRGGYDASLGVFPSTGGSGVAGAVMKGDMWIISVQGTINAVVYHVGDTIIANIDTPGQTSGNWNSLSTNLSYVPEDSANKVTSISGASTNTQYPSAKLVYDQLALKADLISPSFTTPNLGTPSAGTLTNCGSLPVSGITASTSTALGVGSIELGHASDTTIARVSAGVISVEGVTVPTISSTSTLTNKRIDQRVVSAASYTTDTGTSLDVSTCDLFVVTAQAGALKLNNPGGTPVQGQKLMVRLKDNGTARALTYDTQFRAMGVALPSTTVLSKTMYLGFIYNSTDTKWDLVAVAQEA